MGTFHPETSPPRPSRGNWSKTFAPAPPMLCIASLYRGGFRIDDLQRIFHIGQKTVETALAATRTQKRARYKLTSARAQVIGRLHKGKRKIKIVAKDKLSLDQENFKIIAMRELNKHFEARGIKNVVEKEAPAIVDKLWLALSR